MKKTLSLLAVFAVAGMMSAPAQAADHYVSGMAGISWMNDSEISVPGNLEDVVGAEIDLGYGSGLTLAGAIGCDYGSTRLEAEIGYQNADIQDITLGWDRIIAGSYDIPEGSVAAALDGDASVLTLMANGFYDFDLGGVELYVMAGVGVAQVDMEINDVEGLKAELVEEIDDYLAESDFTTNLDINALSADVSETTLAYQIGAGLAVPISDGIMLDARYRYFATTDFTVLGAFDTNVSSHSALLGLRVSL